MWYIYVCIERLRRIRHSKWDAGRVTGRARQTRARRHSSRSKPAAFRLDLADGSARSQTALRRKLARADVLAGMMRAVNSSLDPERVAETLVQQVSDWCLPVLARCSRWTMRDGCVRWLSRALPPTLADVGAAGRRVGHPAAEQCSRRRTCRRIPAAGRRRRRAGRRHRLSARVPGPGEGRSSASTGPPVRRAEFAAGTLRRSLRWRSSPARSRSTTRCACSAPKRCR